MLGNFFIYQRNVNFINILVCYEIRIFSLVISLFFSFGKVKKAYNKDICKDNVKISLRSVSLR